MPSPPVLKLFGRPDCHLCDEARAGLERMRADGAEFELRELDIEADDELFKRYLERIPVVMIGRTEVCELGLDPEAVRAHLGTVSA